MAPNVDEFEFEITGETAVRTAIDALEQFEDSGYNNVQIHLSSVSEESNSPKPTRQAGLGEVSDTEGGQPAEVKPGTSHAKVLSELSRHDNEGPVATKRVLGELDMPEGTVYAAMSDLHDRGLVERTDSRSFNNSYGYTVSEAGEEELDRLRGVE